MNQKRLLVVVSVILLGGALFARQQSSAPMMVYGVGTASCGTWTEARERARTDRMDVRPVQFETWAEGYMTAYGEYAPAALTAAGRWERKTDSAGMKGFLDNYCKDNPTKSFWLAVREFVREQGGRISP
jgi:hypothetical protein